MVPQGGRRSRRTGRARGCMLHFGAVDHDATVWVNDVEVVRHRGGFSSFRPTSPRPSAARRESTIVVRARDSAARSAGSRQAGREYANHDCDYTRTTGIWQTVWLEAVPEVHLQRGAVTPNVGASSFTVELPVEPNRPGWTATAALADERRRGGTAEHAGSISTARRRSP